MQLIITVNMDNAAFDNNPYEIKHILQKAIDLVEGNLENLENGMSYGLLDTNGNRVGLVASDETHLIVKI